MVGRYTDPYEVGRALVGYLQGTAAVPRRARTVPGAVVFDVDGTLLHVRDDGSVLYNDPMVRVYKEAKRHGYRVYVVTARLDNRPWGPKDANNNYKITMAQIQGGGMAVPDHLVLMPHQWLKYPNFSRYKFEARKNLAEARGVPIVLNVGDNWADLGLLEPFVASKPRWMSAPRDAREHVFLQLPDDPAALSVKVPSEQTVEAQHDPREGAAPRRRLLGVSGFKQH